MVFSSGLILRLRLFFLMVSYVSHLSIESFTLISKIDQFDVLKVETFLISSIPVTRGMATLPCDVGRYLSEVNKFTGTIFRCAADYGTGFRLVLYFHSLFTKVILQTYVTGIVVCPFLQRFYFIFMQLNSKRNCSRLKTVINLYWLSAFDSDLSVQI